MTALNILTAAKALISNPRNLSLGFHARNAFGKPTYKGGDKATYFSIVGAIHTVAADLNLVQSFVDEAASFLRSALEIEFELGLTDEDSLMGYNDHHPHEDLMALYDSAIMLASTATRRHEAGCKRQVVRRPQPRLTVVITSYPESNGKRNWTAMFVRIDRSNFDGLVGTGGGIVISHGELWNRVAYQAERARFLLGERADEPFILDYGTDVHTEEEWLQHLKDEKEKK